MDGLTHKQRRFVEEYLLCASATQAAIRAGYSARSAQVTSSRLMDDPAILKAIEEAQAARSERTQVDADYLLQRLFEEIEADLADLYDEETGDLLPLHEWPPVWRRGLVAGVDVEAITADGVEVGKVKKLRLSDRVRRIEALGRHVSVNAFRENIRVEGLSEIADRLMRASSRADREDAVQRLESAPRPVILNAHPEPVNPKPGKTDNETRDASRSLASRQEPVASSLVSDAPAQSPSPALAGDWQEKPSVKPEYAPILPEFPREQSYVDQDYNLFDGGLLASRNKA